MPTMWRTLKPDEPIIPQVESYRKDVHAMKRKVVTIAFSRGDWDKFHREQKTKDHIEMMQTLNVGEYYMVNAIWDYRLCDGEVRVDYTLIPDGEGRPCNLEDF